MEYKIYLAGEFVAGDRQLEVTSPFSGEVVGTTFLASDEQFNESIEAAVAIKKKLQAIPAYQRYDILTQISNGIEIEKDRLAKLLSFESGKPIREAKAEVERTAQTFRIAAEESKRTPSELLQLDWTPSGEKKEGLVRHFPIGVVAGISPFNFPLNLLAHKIAPAIAAGCPIIMKPASATPLSCIELAKIIDETALPKGALSVLPTDRETGNILVTDNRIQLLSFTGSPKVGWEMKAKAGKKKVVLELGGNAGAIITPSANVEKAIERCLVGGYAYSGQVCIHTQRIYVHESHFDNFVKRFCEGASMLVQGDPLWEKTDISVLIDRKNAKRVGDWINEAVGQGAKLLCGGKTESGFVQPTVLTNTNSTMKVNCEEVFGPVVLIEKYNDFSEAITEVNNTKYGLQTGVFTSNIDEMNMAFEELEVGGVIVNDAPTFRVDHMPYGGVKDSGFGREGVKYAMMDMLEPRILVKPT